MRRASLLSALAALMLAPFTRAGSENYAITNATVYTLSAAGKIEHGTILVRDGKIAAVGANVAIPPDAESV